MSSVTANGIQIEYETFGNPSGRPLLLIIGFSGQMIEWDEDLCKDLAKRGHYVIRFDNRDTGLSTKFDDAGVPNIGETIGKIMKGEEINYPAASSGVLEQRQLMVFMELIIIISLLFHIIRDRMLIAVFPYGTCKIPVRPEFSSPKLFSYLRTPLEHFPCRNAFDRRYDFCHTIRRDRLHEEMYMILIYPYLQKLHLIALLNFHTHAFQCFIHTSVEYRTSVFRRKYQMVYQHRNIMTFVDIFAHIDILRRKRRGIQPEEI